MKKKDLVLLLSAFLSWRILLSLFLFLAIKFVPLQKNFLGGGMANYLANTWVWAWANFDGEHYLSIAYSGYKHFQHFFFPVYPLTVRFFALFLAQDFKNYLYSGVFVSNLSFLVALIGFWKLIRLDFDRKKAELALILLLLFPTSFFFGSVYTESLFLALVVWSFYFARKGDWIFAGILAGISTATRIVGIALFPALIIEAWTQKNKKGIAASLLTLSGLVIYMYYLKISTGNPFEFFNTVSIFGEQRSTSLILLPQVFYRYIFKILPNANYNNFSSFYPIILEFAMGTVFFILSILSFWKLRISYSIYLAIGYILPALSGSFSSFPRYVLVLFPAFILGSIYLSKANRIVRISIFVLLFILLTVSTIIFSRGYWIS